MRPPQLRTLVDDVDYTPQYDALPLNPSNPDLEAAIAGLYWGIAKAPEQFDIANADLPLRIAKSNERLREGTIRIWFEIRDPDYADLKFIEFTPSDL